MELLLYVVKLQSVVGVGLSCRTLSPEAMIEVGRNRVRFEEGRVSKETGVLGQGPQTR